MKAMAKTITLTIVRRYLLQKVGTQDDEEKDNRSYVTRMLHQWKSSSESSVCSDGILPEVCRFARLLLVDHEVRYRP